MKRLAGLTVGTPSPRRRASSYAIWTGLLYHFPRAFYNIACLRPTLTFHSDPGIL